MKAIIFTCKCSHRITGHAAVNGGIGNSVTPQAIGAMGTAGILACYKQTLECCVGIDIADYATHKIMRRGNNLNTACGQIKTTISAAFDHAFEFLPDILDTKLAQETRGGTVLQLCLYSDLVGRVQDRMPARMHVVKPGTDFEPDSFMLEANRHFLMLGDEDAALGAPGGRIRSCSWLRS